MRGSTVIVGGMNATISAEQLWSPAVIAQLATAAWHTSATFRSLTCHRPHPCPTRRVPYGEADPRAELADPRCEAAGCLDLLHDLLARMLAKIQRLQQQSRQGIANWEGYARRIAQNELTELRRAQRVAVGFAAKPLRTDGVPSRIIAGLAAHGGARGEWLVALFRILRSYPFSPTHVPGRWPVDGLVTERQHYLQHGNTAAEVRKEITLVLATAARLGGKQWAYDHLVLPLNTAPANTELPDTLGDPRVEVEDQVLIRWLRDAYARSRSAGMSPEVALSVASVEVAGRPAPSLTGELQQALDELETGWLNEHRKGPHARS